MISSSFTDAFSGDGPQHIASQNPSTPLLNGSKNPIGTPNRATTTVVSSTGSTTGKLLSPGAYVEVYDPDFQHVISICSERVLHTPHPSLGVSRLVLCRNFTVDNPAACPKGETCKFVHADTLGAKKHPIHVNYAWRSEDLVTYARLPAGEILHVLAPNERPPSEEVPSERVLVTRGSLMRKEHSGPLSHCAHYYFNRMCNRGERCNFVHAILVDPNASDLQRAPAPTAVAPLVRQQTSAKHPHRIPRGAPMAQPGVSLVTFAGHSVIQVPSSSNGVQSFHLQHNGGVQGSTAPPPPPPPPGHSVHVGSAGSGPANEAPLMHDVRSQMAMLQLAPWSTGGPGDVVQPTAYGAAFAPQFVFPAQAHTGGRLPQQPIYVLAPGSCSYPQASTPSGSQSADAPRFFEQPNGPAASQHVGNSGSFTVSVNQPPSVIFVSAGGVPTPSTSPSVAIPPPSTSFSLWAPTTSSAASGLTSTSPSQSTPTDADGRPSMTSIFLPIPGGGSQDAQSAATTATASCFPQPPANALGQQSMPNPNNPMDWSFIGSVYNNGSSMLSQSFSHSMSGRLVPHQ